MKKEVLLLERLMLVEDDPDIRFVVCQVLEKLGGFQIKAYASGKEALQAVEELKPQMILLDVMMPGMDGPTTLKELRKKPACKDLPIVFITAKTQHDEVEKLQKLGVQAVISKPFDPKTLTQQIYSIWNKFCP